MNQSISEALAWHLPHPATTTRQAIIVDVEPLAGDRSLLVTETRTDPADEAARRKFRLYWGAVALFAALIRQLALAVIAARAEAAAISNPAQPADPGQRTMVSA